MIKNLLTILLFFVLANSYGQIIIKKSTICSGGETVTKNTLTTVYSIGEIAIQEITLGNIHISEGFINPEILGVQQGIKDYKQLVGVSIYPNPCVDIVHVHFSVINQYIISIFDSSGKQLQTVSTSNLTEKLNFDTYVSGIYFMFVQNTITHEYMSYKLIKK